MHTLYAPRVISGAHEGDVKSGNRTGISEKLRYSQILVPVDRCAVSICGLHEAIKIATGQGRKLRLLHIVKAPMLDYGFTAAPVQERCRRITHRIWEEHSQVIIDQAKKRPASLVVTGKSRERWNRPRWQRHRGRSRHAQVAILFVRNALTAPESSEYSPLDYAFVA